MRPATGAMKGTLITGALPVCRAAREVSTTLIATSDLPPIDLDETGSTLAAEPWQFKLVNDMTKECKLASTHR